MHPVVSFLEDLQYATPQRRRLLAEAFLSLAAVRLTLRLLSFQRLTAGFGRPVTLPEVSNPKRRQLCGDVRWAIRRAKRWLPGKTVCFPRAIAAQAMLRRRGVGTDLYYGGAILPEKGLTTHVWLQDGAEGVVGHRAAGLYQVLACYSSRRTEQPSQELLLHAAASQPPEQPPDFRRDAGL